MFRQRLRLRYSVEEDKKYLSHHDMMRLWHRALRRSRLPLRMSEGFHVRPKVSFAQARGVGIASKSEWLEFELADWVNPDTAKKLLATELPSGIAICEFTTVAPSDRAIVRQVVYRLRPAREFDNPQQCIDALLNRDEIVVTRGTDRQRRQIDIRPLLVSLTQVDDELELVAASGQSGSLRPTEVLAELGLTSDDIARSHIVRIDAQLQRQPS